MTSIYLFSFLLIVSIIPTFAMHDGTIHSASFTPHEDYVKYDLSKEYVPLNSDIKKIPLPSDIKQSMLDYCANINDYSTSNERFWDVVPIRILSATPEFDSLQVNTNSFVIHSYSAEESCPPNVEMLGIFTSENGDEHKFNLLYDGNFFKYQIDDIFPPRFQLITSPLKQLKAGVPMNDIKCKEGLQLIFKTTNNNPVCVKSETKEKLIERGWAKPV